MREGNVQANVTHQSDAGVIEILGTLALRGVLIEVEPDFRARTGLSPRFLPARPGTWRS